MAVVAESALEVPTEHNSSQQVLSNIEINNKCRFTSDCGSHCILNQLAPSTAALSQSTVLQIGEEIVLHGRSIRHLVIAGKEPLETPSRVFSLLRAYHAAPVDTRPGAVGLLTSGVGLDTLIDSFTQNPLSWCIVSIDSKASGLRQTQQCSPDDTLRVLESLRVAGGTSLTGVNTVVTADNETDILRLADSIEISGVNQWALSPLLMAHGDEMKPQLPTSLLASSLERLAKRLDGLRTLVSLDVNEEVFKELTGGREVAADTWRSSYSIYENVRLTAKTYSPGFFFRVRFDGQLLSRKDFMKVRLNNGSYGHYYSGRVESLLRDLEDLRGQTGALHERKIAA